MGGKPGEETLRVPDQRFPLPLVGDQLGEPHGVWAGDGPKPSLPPVESPVAAEGSRALPGVVIRQKLQARSPVFRGRELARDRVARRLFGWRRVGPWNPNASKGGHCGLDPVEQSRRIQREQFPKREKVPPRLLQQRRSHPPILGTQAERILTVQHPAHECDCQASGSSALLEASPSTTARRLQRRRQGQDVQPREALEIQKIPHDRRVKDTSQRPDPTHSDGENSFLMRSSYTLPAQLVSTLRLRPLVSTPAAPACRIRPSALAFSSWLSPRSAARENRRPRR